MKVEYDYKKCEFNVRLEEGEVIQAFTSFKDLQLMMHNIVKNTYGEEMADKCFPIAEERVNNEN